MKKLILALILFKILGAVVLSGFDVLHKTISSSEFFTNEKEFLVEDLSENIDIYADYDYQY